MSLIDTPKSDLKKLGLKGAAIGGSVAGSKPPTQRVFIESNTTSAGSPAGRGGMGSPEVSTSAPPGAKQRWTRRHPRASR